MPRNIVHQRQQLLTNHISLGNRAFQRIAVRSSALEEMRQDTDTQKKDKESNFFEDFSGIPPFQVTLSAFQKKGSDDTASQSSGVGTAYSTTEPQPNMHWINKDMRTLVQKCNCLLCAGRGVVGVNGGQAKEGMQESIQQQKRGKGEEQEDLAMKMSGRTSASPLKDNVQTQIERNRVLQRMNQDDESEEGYASDEDVVPKVDAETAVGVLIPKMKKIFTKAANYCVAALDNGDLMITKVNGVTAKASGMDKLAQYIRKQKIDKGRRIYLAQKYNTALGSNHAEMCILAAARVVGAQVTYMGCTGPNCPYCAQMMSDEGVPSLNAGQDGKAQMGWAHPWENLFWGQQVSNDPVANQVADLASVNAGQDARIGRATLAPSQGRCSRWNI